MSNEEISQRLSVMREMIEKGRRETAESGRFFVWMGVIALAGLVAIRVLETVGRGRLLPPVLVLLLAASGVVGFLTVARRQERAGARSYFAIICYRVWLACAVSGAMAVFLFPLLGVYPWTVVPVLTSLIVGIAVFSSGVVLESPPLVWSSLAWWIGAVGLALVGDGTGAPIMAGVIVLGWILPGVILNRDDRAGSAGDEA